MKFVFAPDSGTATQVEPTSPREDMNVQVRTGVNVLSVFNTIAGKLRIDGGCALWSGSCPRPCW